MFNSQARQDEFVLDVLNYKRDGYFLEIGSQDPIHTNNSYVLEHNFNWNGIMVEYDPQFEHLYKKHRTSNYIIQDARKIDYNKLLSDNSAPKNIDYLQIDLDVNNSSTIDTLLLLEESVFPNYTFTTVTFEHDIYTGNYFNTQIISRDVFKKQGYELVINNRCFNGDKFEDWYIHSSYYNTLSQSFIHNIKAKYQN